MKRITRLTAIILSALMTFATIFSVVAVCSVSLAAEAASETVEYGNYPQSEVKDESLKAALNASKAEWKSFSYYTGTGSWYDGTMSASDFMKYCDVKYGEKWYRGVTFSDYRPYWTGYTSSEDNSFQDNNGFVSGETYWFEYEPLKWKVIDSENGLLLCETIIDSQPFNSYLLASGKDYRGYTAYWGSGDKTYYANNYVSSSIRKWLSEDFISTAFTTEQCENIAVTHLDNSCSDPSKTAFNAPDSDDKVFLLSMNDALNNSYGFSEYISYGDKNRVAYASDYARCQGLNDFGSAASWWWLRTAEAGSGSCDAYFVGANGKVNQHATVIYTNHGVRPAMVLKEMKNDTKLKECVHKDADGDLICDICNSFIESDTPDEPTEVICSHICHKTGLMGFFWKIQKFFFRIFGTNKVCSCGIEHY